MGPRYLRLLWFQIRTSALLSMQNRGDFVLDAVVSNINSLAVVVPLFVVFQDRKSFAGWTFGESLLVVGWFVLLRGIIEGGISPSLVAVVEHIRKGTLDFVLLKPVDAQFLVSTAKFELWRSTRVLAALVILGYAFHQMGRLPTPGAVAVALLLLIAATLLLYSFWILTVSAAFYVVKIDNLMYLFDAVFDAARWPANVFKGVVGIIFTYILPLALMTTYPAQALLGRLSVTTLLVGLSLAALFGVVSRRVWLRSIGHYTSASS
jgi:ABC-2 type transport system permease protein